MANPQEQNSVLIWIIAVIGENLLKIAALLHGGRQIFTVLHGLRGGVASAGFLSRCIGILGKSGGKDLPKHNRYEKLCKSLAGAVFNVFG